MTELPKAEKLGYSIAEACAASSLGRTTLYAHIAAGRLKANRVGGRTIVLADSLKALLRQDLPEMAGNCAILRGEGDQ